MFHKQALPDICKQVKIEGVVGLQTETKEMCLLFFYAISVFAVLSGNSLEEPLGDLPTPSSANTVKRMARTHKTTHTHTHAKTLAERKRETNAMLRNRGGHQTWNALYYFTVIAAFVFLLSAINMYFSLLILLCDTASEPA